MKKVKIRNITKKRFSVTIDIDVYEKIELISSSLGRPRSTLMNELLIDALENYEVLFPDEARKRYFFEFLKFKNKKVKEDREKQEKRKEKENEDIPA